MFVPIALLCFSKEDFHIHLVYILLFIERTAKPVHKHKDSASERKENLFSISRV